MADEPEDEDEAGMEPDEPDALKERDKELSRMASIRRQLIGGDGKKGLWPDIEAGFVGQADRVNTSMDNWDAYKCVLSSNQYYNGNSKVFFPIISNAIRARATRFANQLFPNSGRYVDAVTANGDIPYAEMALIEHYVRREKLKNSIVKPLFIAGDIEGNYSIYVDWRSTTRHVMTRVQRPVQDGDQARPELGEVEDVIAEDVVDAGPDVTIIPDSDLLILPVTAKNPADAIAQGGSVTIRRRFTKETILRMGKEGEFDPKAAKAYADNMQTEQAQAGQRDTSKKIGEAAGIRVRQGKAVGVVAEVWTKLKIDGEWVLCRAYFGGDDQILGCKRNPFWHDRCPLISEPVSRDMGMAKGRPPTSDVMDIQAAANDMVNEAIDVSNFAAMPIVAADPEAVPQSATMVLGLGAVWDVPPDKVKFLDFPALYERLLPFIERLETAIMQTLGVNPAMLPNATGKPGAKRNQAEIAMELQVDLLNTAEAASVMEDVLNQMLEMWAELDHQFRDKPMMVRAFGPMGRRAKMEEIGPLQIGKAYEFTWLGVEAARNAAMAQQQIAAIATLTKIPPQLMPGYKIDLTSVVQQIALSQFGPRIAPLTIVSLKDEQSLAATEENEMLAQGFDLPVHPQDDDLEHIRTHLQGMAQSGDEHGNHRWHIEKHNIQRTAKATAAAQAQAKSGGAPGGGGPQAGAQPGAPKPGPRMPGAINEDQMTGAGAVLQPRKT